MTLIEPFILPKFDSMPQMPSRMLLSTPYLASMAASSLVSSWAFCLPVSMRAWVTDLTRYSDVVELNSGWLSASFSTTGSGSVMPLKAASKSCLETPAFFMRGHSVSWMKAMNLGSSASAGCAMKGANTRSEAKIRRFMWSPRFGRARPDAPPLYRQAFQPPNAASIGHQPCPVVLRSASFRSQLRAVSTMKSRFSCFGCQPSTSRTRAAPATMAGGSPGRRGP